MSGASIVATSSPLIPLSCIASTWRSFSALALLEHRITSHRIRRSSTIAHSLTLTLAQMSAKNEGSPWYAFKLRTAIILMVVFDIALIATTLTVISYTAAQTSNASAISQGTQSINALASVVQKGESDKIRTSIDTYLKKLWILGNTTATLVYRGILDPTDYDSLIPFMIDSTLNSNLSLSSWYYWNNATLESAGVGIVTPAVFGDLSRFGITYDPSTTLFQMQYYATNKTCRNYCPMVSTGKRLTYYFINQTLNTATTQLSITNDVYKGWTRPWFVNRLPLGQAWVTPVYMAASRAGSPPRLLQAITFSLWSPNGSYIGMGPLNFATYDMSAGLNEMKGTPNSFYYIMTPQAEVLAMTGVFMDQSPLMRYSAATSSWVLNKIWDYNLTSYPILNISAAKIWAHAGGNLSSDFADAQFAVGDVMFQCTSYWYANFKWIIVSGAPATDYLGDTLQLQNDLSDKLWRVQQTTIIIAVGVCLGMSVLSVMFTEIFIAKPLHIILSAIGKATKFDFSTIREGEIRSSMSVVQEIYVLQERFMTMMRTFADALRNNKALATVHGRNTSNNINSKLPPAGENGSGNARKQSLVPSAGENGSIVLPAVKEHPIIASSNETMDGQ
ncbi:hypothetical protein M427DRAFT_30646 [Gonapodya prolifera JEL478]|uniref:HAMP domain-containing protein n=1 Tax=Gonapodya prolifera (strain JEL478) TaxID=1344416 RepID=A0A139AKY9_GONPJ|nr:hypothetical protein M427DRAFT_30646 [Gonapodya prolifera JEL478]|eukprot:KXS17184.1 hypothetical protein M427DRAFT_30646 [Gonapodya prolifera JEL478]